MSDNLYRILAERGLIAQSTDAAMEARLARPLSLYAGFDPTADSLHVGHLVPVMVLAWAQRLGHRPLAVVGGATGLVGDPSGKSEARKMLTRADVAANARAIGAQIARLVRFGSGAGEALLLDNADWLAERSWIDVLREWGPHFSVNRMLTMDSVRSRLDGGGLSFLEFNYMIMQAADFAHLHQVHGCTLQVGGQDQWGNIVMGIELGRRLHGADLAGLTLPLVTKSDGGKFGKTESGAVWLDAGRTSPFAFWQFWRNVADADVARYLAYFTFLPMAEVQALTAEGGKAMNHAKEVLASEMTTLIHGAAAAAEAAESAARAFAGGRADAGGEAIPHANLSASELADGIGLLTLLVRAGLAASNGEARRLVQGGGVRLHEEAISDPARQLGSADAIDGALVVRVGKKKLFRYDVA
jgi:tyrosyl-tRNA synthetase